MLTSCAVLSFLRKQACCFLHVYSWHMTSWRSATHCNTLQHTATHYTCHTEKSCSVLQVECRHALGINCSVLYQHHGLWPAIQRVSKTVYCSLYEAMHAHAYLPFCTISAHGNQFVFGMLFLCLLFRVLFVCLLFRMLSVCLWHDYYLSQRNRQSHRQRAIIRCLRVCCSVCCSLCGSVCCSGCCSMCCSVLPTKPSSTLHHQSAILSTNSTQLDIFRSRVSRLISETHCYTLQHGATHIATHCNTLPHAAAQCNTNETQCNTRQCIATNCNTLKRTATQCNTHCNTLHHTATQCNTMPHNATYYNTLQHAATHCNTRYNKLQHTATNSHAATHCNTHCNALQHTATHCNTLQRNTTYYNTKQHTATHCNTLHHIATHTNTLQHTATHTATHCNALQHTVLVLRRLGVAP